MLDAAEAAADRLTAEGRSVSLWDARVVKPLDPEMLADAATHPCVLTVEDGVREGGVGSAIGDQLAEHTLGDHEPRVRVLGTPIAYLAHGKPDAILADLGLDRDGIMASALSLLAGDHVPHEG
jgi:1-deoxy-D-xylulose-5-phosphate synthase